jgi:hypothetical protein
VRRARSAANHAKRAHASVVVTSIVTTLLAWAMFSSQDAQAIEAARTATSAQAAMVVTAQSQSGDNAQVSPTQVPLAVTTTGTSK